MIIVISAILLFLITAILVRGISRSIEAEVPEGAEAVIDFYEDEDED
jgi:small-conductance mechanosensitive channel